MPELQLQEIIHTYVMPWAPSVLQALLIFLIGRLAVKVVVKISDTLIRRTPLDNILIRFATSFISSMLMLVVIIAALNPLGVETTSLIALIGAAGLAIGLALQDSLKNFAAGVMLILFRPFKEGDFVEVGGSMGIIENIQIMSTIMRSGDNKEITIPNAAIYGNTMTNYSARPTRRVDMVFGISYDADLKLAKDILIQLVNEDERTLQEPAPVVAVGALNDSSVDILVRPWVKGSDYWGYYWGMQEKVKLAFDAAGVGIPYPQMDVHFKPVDAPKI